MFTQEPKAMPIATLILASLCCQTAKASWVIEEVDTGSISSISLKIDGAGYPHISYENGTTGSLQYAMRDGTGWNPQVVDTGGVGRGSSLALDAYNRPSMSYHDEINHQAKHTAWDGSQWNTDIVGGGTGGRYATGLVLDTADTPHVGYVTSGHLAYASQNGASWDVQVVDATTDTTELSLARDSNNNAHFSYYDHTNRDLRYATWTGSSWDLHIIEETGTVGQWSQIYIDTSDNVHIAYYSQAEGSVKYAYGDGQSWTIQSLDTGGTGSIVVDENSIPHISYVNQNGLIYTTLNEGAWESQIVDAQCATTAEHSIALDASGNPYIAYNPVNQQLMFAAIPEPATLSLLTLGGLIASRRRR